MQLHYNILIDLRVRSKTTLLEKKIIKPPAIVLRFKFFIILRSIILVYTSK